MSLLWNNAFPQSPAQNLISEPQLTNEPLRFLPLFLISFSFKKSLYMKPRESFVNTTKTPNRRLAACVLSEFLRGSESVYWNIVSLLSVVERESWLFRVAYLSKDQYLKTRPRSRQPSRHVGMPEISKYWSCTEKMHAIQNTGQPQNYNSNL